MAGGAVGNGVQGAHGAGGGAAAPQQPPWSSVGEFLAAVKLPQCVLRRCVLGVYAAVPCADPPMVAVRRRLCYDCGGLAVARRDRYEREFAAEDMTDVGLLVGMARRDRAELREALKEVGVTKLGHFERIAQALEPYAK